MIIYLLKGIFTRMVQKAGFEPARLPNLAHVPMNLRNRTALLMPECVYHFAISALRAGDPGYDPGLAVSKTAVRPLHLSPIIPGTLCETRTHINIAFKAIDFANLS